jgi:5-methylcytosine-specific restriction endonuclease McrA
MIRVGIYKIEEVLPYSIPFKLHTEDKNRYRMYGEFKVSMTSDRYRLFKERGIKCVKCGIKGRYFALEKQLPKSELYHFNLYAIDIDNKEVLMTKDHIIPKSKGGRSFIDNYQTLCTRCNMSKRDKVEENDSKMV